jgi:predicted nucleic acid-binding protein
MKVCVDTSVWALALKRGGNSNSPYIKELHELIKEVRVQMLGLIRLEILASIRNKEQYEIVKRTLSEFPDLALKTIDYETAAELFHLCKAHDVIGAYTDFLICAAAIRNNLSILTTDKDFSLFAQLIPIKLLQPRT